MRKNHKHLGKRYGNWEVINFISTERKYLARCICGTEKMVYIGNLTSGRSTNCGCIQKEKISVARTKHGDYKSKLYNVYRGMRNRCFNTKTNSYKDYGAKGIKVCEEWMEYTTFKEWAFENGYADGLEIDRIDGKKDYSPLNCRWVTRLENARNKERNLTLTINGITKTHSEWEEENGLRRGIIRDRIKLGWEEKDLLNFTSKERNGQFEASVYITLNNQNLTLMQISELYNIKLGTLRNRYKKGIREEEIVKPLDPRNIEREIICIDTGTIYKSATEIQKVLGIERRNIGLVCQGKRKTAGGFKWAYLKEEK